MINGTVQKTHIVIDFTSSATHCVVILREPAHLNCTNPGLDCTYESDL